MRCLVRGRIFAVPASFSVTDKDGNEAFHVQGKVFRWPRTYQFTDPEENLPATLRTRPFSLPAAMDIVRDGAVAARVRGAFLSPLKRRYTADLSDGSRLEATGEFTNMEWVSL